MRLAMSQKRLYDLEESPWRDDEVVSLEEVDLEVEVGFSLR